MRMRAEEKPKQDAGRRSKCATGRCPEAAGQGGGQAHTQLELMESRSLHSLAEKKSQCLCKGMKTYIEQRVPRRAGKDSKRTMRSLKASRALVCAYASPQHQCLQILLQVNTLLKINLKRMVCLKETLLTNQNQHEGLTWHRMWLMSC